MNFLKIMSQPFMYYDILQTSQGGLKNSLNIYKIDFWM